MAIPLLCAVTNAVAAALLAAVLAPGTTLVPDPEVRAIYVREHLLLWRLGWGSWIVASTAFLALFVWWERRVPPHPTHRVAVGLAALAWASDMTAQALLIGVVPDRPDVTPTAFALTGGVTNTLYTIAGVIMSVGTPMGRALRMWTAAMWSAGAGVSVSVVFDIPAGAAVASAALYALFVPWCVALGRALRR